MLTVTGPTEGEATPSLVVTREALCAQMGLGAYSSGWLARLREQIPVEELTAVEHVQIAGRRGHLRQLAWSAAGSSIVQFVGLVTAGEDGYAVVCSGPADRAAALEPVFRSLIADLRLDVTDVVPIEEASA